MENKHMIKQSILGAIVGDAMGVPYEFRDKIAVRKKLTDKMEFDTRRNLPSGTWSDDSSMILCTIESLNDTGTNMKAIGDNYVRWYKEAHWTPYGRVFDIGSTTREAIENMIKGNYVNGEGEYDKGNGSLMRVLPLACYLHDKPIEQIKETVENFSALTHSTKECKIACVWYALLVSEMVRFSKFPKHAITRAELNIMKLYTKEDLLPFKRILSDEILFLAPVSLNGSGYVVHSLEVVMNCISNSQDFRSAIIRAISVGDDTDTNASLVGGLMGLTYNIPQSWVDEIARKDDILELLEDMDWKD